jgi:NADH dehydrogenase
MTQRLRVVILGGGFAGVYTAKQLFKQAKPARPVDVHIVNRENYMVFQPMLPEVISGSVGIADTVSPIRRIVPKASLHMRDVESVDIENNTVTCSPGFRPKPLVLEYDHLVIALGNVTDFRGMTGLAEHAKPFKTLGDALALRNHVIHILEEADGETDRDVRDRMLTFIVAGGGFSGVEVIAELNDFVTRAVRAYPHIEPGDCRFVLIHSRDVILQEVDPSLGRYAQQLLHKRGIEMLLGDRLAAATAEHAILKSGMRIATKTLVATVPSHPNPVVEALDLPKHRGKLLADATTRVRGTPNVWALGDCALIPMPGHADEKPKYAPPTAQHAIREARVCGDNILAAADGRTLRDFQFTGLGSLAALGHRKGVAQIMNVKISGLPAWLMWRTIYLMKLPGLDRKVRVGAAWFLDLFLQPDLVQLRVGKSSGVNQEHFEPGQTVFEQGDLGDRVYIIVTGSAQVVRVDNGVEQQLATLGAGQYFGEMALLNRAARNATVRCVEAMDVLSIEKGDFNALIGHLDEMRESFERTAAKREGSS